MPYLLMLLPLLLMLLFSLTPRRCRRYALSRATLFAAAIAAGVAAVDAYAATQMLRSSVCYSC